MVRPIRHWQRFAVAALAVVLTLGLAAASCTPEAPAEDPAAIEPTIAAEVADGVVPEIPAEPEKPEALEPVETAPDDVPVAVLEPVSDRADLGEFNEYEPADVDPAPLSVDEDVLIGMLDNGLRYYLRNNDSPAESVEMRLVVDAGAVLDPEGAEGLAHYLEHMLFNGTERFSRNELIQALRNIGTDFGPDLNAYTSADETVYMFDFRLDNPEALDLAFEVLSQWLSAATIRPDDVEAERGIVIDEYRLRSESASGRISDFLDAIYYTGSIYEGMHTGGSEDSNAAITTAQLREFYETWYRPDNAAVIIVGDLPVTEMEQKVEQFFGGLARPADAIPAQPERHAFTADFISDPLTDVVTVAGPRFWYQADRDIFLWEGAASSPAGELAARLILRPPAVPMNMAAKPAMRPTSSRMATCRYPITPPPRSLPGAIGNRAPSADARCCSRPGSAPASPWLPRA